MNSNDVKRLALILSVQAEIEGMKTSNMEQKKMNYPLTYYEESFRSAAEELRMLAYKHDDAL